MLNETYPNSPPEPRRRAVGAPEAAFGLGFLAAVAGLALVSIALALVVAGTLAMVIAWRVA